MPDLLAGTTILAQDTPPPAEADNGTNLENLTNTSYEPGTSELGVTFSAPTSERVMIHCYGAFNSDGTNLIFISVEVYEGTDSTGTLITSASDNNAIANDTGRTRQSSQFQQSGLTPGVTYFARTVHRVQGGTTSDIFHRRITVNPLT